MSYKLFRERLNKVKNKLNNAEEKVEKLDTENAHKSAQELAEMSKSEIDDYAEEEFGIELDGRHKKDSMIKDFISKLKG